MSDLVLLTAQADIDLKAAEGKRPSVSIRPAYGGGLMRVSPFGWLVIALNALEVPPEVPLLADHANAIDRQVGTVVPKIVGNALVAEGVLTESTEAGKTVVGMARDGITRMGASVGVEIIDSAQLFRGDVVEANGRRITLDRETLHVTRGRLREISLTPTGADHAAQAIISARLEERGKTMSENTTTTQHTITESTTAAIMASRASDDSQRVRTIEATYGAYPMTDPNLQAEAAELRIKAMAGEFTTADFNAGMLAIARRDRDLERVRGTRPAGPQIRSIGEPAVGNAVIEAAFLAHLGHERVAEKTLGAEAAQRGRDLRAHSLEDVFRAAWQAKGVDAPRERTQLIKASFSTADIANVVTSAQNKILLDQFQRMPLLCLQLAKQMTATDFKESKAVRLVGHSLMEEVGKTGEIKHGHLTDFSAPYTIATYAKVFTITRQDIINDNLGAFNDIPAIIARGAGLKMESVFWRLVMNNANSFFADGNGNHIADVLGTAGLAAGVAAMRNQTDADGEPIMAEPRFLVVPPTLESTADGLFVSTNLAVGGTAGAIATVTATNTFANKYVVKCSPYLENANYTNYSTTAWYLFADPNVGPSAFIGAFLNGQTQPTIEQSAADFDTLGVQFRGYVDFAFAQCDPEGAVMSTGSGS